MSPIRIVFICIILLAGAPAGAAYAESGLPNIVIILTDDQRADTLTPELMPLTWKGIVEQGILFEHAYVTTPLCCPSRASIFTGTLARTHGVMRNGTDSNTVPFATMDHFPEDLRNHGYYTGLVGKFLNSWKRGWTGRRKLEFEYWTGIRKPLNEDPYYNFALQHNKSVELFRCADPSAQDCAYMTDELAKESIRFLENAVESGRPFLLYFAPLAPHGPSTPAKRHESLYTQLENYRPPSFAEEDISDKPLWMQEASWIPRDASGKPMMPDPVRAEIDTVRLKQLRTLAAVDEAVHAILQYLRSVNKLDNTFILFTSDNGHYWGEHFLRGKNAAYTEAIRVPLAIRYPRLIPAGMINTEDLVANIDFAPTFYDLAELPVPAQIEGQSLLSLFRDANISWRKRIFFEGWPDKKGDIGHPDQCRPPFRAILTGRFKYIEYQANIGTGVRCVFQTSDKPELYDVSNDPYELNNLAGNPAYHLVEEELRQELAKYPKVDAPVQ